MHRNFATLAVVAIAGAVAGWYLLAGRLTSPVDPHDHSETRPTVEVSHRWPLLPADAQGDTDPPVVAVDAKGRVLVAWSSQTGAAERTLFLARSEDEADNFEKPVAFRKVGVYQHTATSKGKSMSHPPSAQPRLAAHGDTILLGWTEAVNGGPRVDFLVAATSDGGKTFSPPTRVHSDAAVRPNCTALSAGPEGAFTVAWLDARNGAQQVFSATGKVGGPAMESLAFAGVDGKGVCPCCDVAALRDADGRPLLAFRHNRDGFRDICVTRGSDVVPGTFDEPTAVSDEHWKFEGCPHDAPSVARIDKSLHVAWMDAHEGKQRVYLASGGLSDRKFTPRTFNPSPAGEQGHPKLVSFGFSLHLVWDEALPGAGDGSAKEEHGHDHNHGQSALGSGRAIFYAASDNEGETFASPQKLQPKDGVIQTHPSVAVSASGAVLVAWAERSPEGNSIALVRLSVVGADCCSSCATKKSTDCCVVPLPKEKE